MLYNRAKHLARAACKFFSLDLSHLYPPPSSGLFPSLSLSFISLPGGLQAFRGFLRSEFSEENLKFWLACEDYRVSPSKTKARSIYSQFINPDAPQEVGWWRGECDIKATWIIKIVGTV